jgi:hypothetical protein
VKLEQIQSLAKSAHCNEARAEATAIGKPVEKLDFTRNGLGPFLNSARAKYLLAETRDSCGDKSEAAAQFKQIAADTELSNLFWAAHAAKHLDNYDQSKWTERLNSAISQADERAQRDNSKVWSMYIIGTLRIAAGQTDSGARELRDALLLPDSRMAHHFIRLALSESAHPQN